MPTPLPPTHKEIHGSAGSPGAEVHKGAINLEPVIIQTRPNCALCGASAPETLPLSGSNSPSARRNIVDFSDPFGPTRQIRSPAEQSKDTSWSTSSEPKE